MEFPILYSFRRCPYAMRARMALKYSEINYIHREIKLSNRPDELYKISRLQIFQSEFFFLLI